MQCRLVPVRCFYVLWRGCLRRTQQAEQIYFLSPCRWGGCRPRSLSSLMTIGQLCAFSESAVICRCQSQSAPKARLGQLEPTQMAGSSIPIVSSHVATLPHHASCRLLGLIGLQVRPRAWQAPLTLVCKAMACANTSLPRRRVD